MKYIRRRYRSTGIRRPIMYLETSGLHAELIGLDTSVDIASPEFVATDFGRLIRAIIDEAPDTAVVEGNKVVDIDLADGTRVKYISFDTSRPRNTYGRQFATICRYGMTDEGLECREVFNLFREGTINRFYAQGSDPITTERGYSQLDPTEKKRLFDAAESHLLALLLS